MHYSALSRIRDIILLGALFFLIKTVFEQNHTFLVAHKKSMIHELDRTFIDHLYTAQRQAHALEEHVGHGSIFSAAITDIKNQLATIEEKYKTNSSGLALLGPIGTASIVLKEEKLNQKLLHAINKLGHLACTISTIELPFTAAETVANGLHANKIMIKNLIT
jgi:hypothetical protein